MKKIKEYLMLVADVLEKLVALLLMVAVVVGVAYEIPILLNGAREGLSSDGMQIIVEQCFNLIIVIEFVRMLIKHTMGTVVEILIYAMARTLILSHDSIWEVAISVVAIVILLAARKFLFLEHDIVTEDEEEELENKKEQK